MSVVGFGFNGAARGGPAYSGNHRKDSAGHRPHEARTTQWQCCLPHLQEITSWLTWFVMYTDHWTLPFNVHHLQRQPTSLLVPMHGTM